MDFWIFDFSILEFWIFGILDFGWKILPSIYMHHKYIYIHICALAKPGFCSGGRIFCKPNNGALLSTSINRNHDSKVLIIVHCLVPVLVATMIVKVLVPVWIYYHYC